MFKGAGSIPLPFKKEKEMIIGIIIGIAATLAIGYCIAAWDYCNYVDKKGVEDIEESIYY